MRVVFMGTPDFAVPALHKLIEEKHEIVAVVTQPDKPKGRGGMMQFTPVKETAIAHGISVFQPQKVREEEFLKQLEQMVPEVIVVVAYGQLLPQRILELPKYGCVNIHASLLPKYRGAAPIQWAVINGETESGVTTMRMDVGLDTGDILLKKEILLEAKETGGSLHDKLAVIGAELLGETLQGLEKGTLKPQKQGEMTTAYAKMLEKSMGNIDFSQPAKKIEALIRGLNPWPSAYTYLEGKTLKIWAADVEENVGKVMDAGTILEIRKDAICVQTADGVLKLLEIQLEGKKRMNVADFLRGYHLESGSRLPS